ncbi:MAG: biotin synthase BioB [Proteobacteria bacterium]|nr:biotin synthase BioB [Pseudomonadota bacterium]
MINKALQQILSGKNLEFDQALALVQQSDPTQLFQAADELRLNLHKNRLDLCSIVNAKSGKCSEDCKFCAQSSHYNVEVASYEAVDREKAISLARENEQHGVQRFSLVTAGKTVSDKNLLEFSCIYQQLQHETNLSLCASMGLLTREKARQLKDMGVSRYHCNLETARSYFPEVCSTHTWGEKVATIRIAQDAGLEVCSGGIIGMGESLAQRLELAFELRELGILSIPLNILTPIKDTPFAGLKPLSVGEVLTCVAMFRFINPNAIIRLAGGRNLLGDQQHRCFTSGANGSIVGNYLTTIGNNLTEDIAMFQSLGFDLSGDGKSKE